MKFLPEKFPVIQRFFSFSSPGELDKQTLDLDTMNDHHDSPASWHFAVDRGGTFTDVMGIDPKGSIHTRKLLSESDAYEDAGMYGIAKMLGIDPSRPIDDPRIGSIRIGTTVATNALLERKGAQVALCTTAGFEDLLLIGNGARQELFSLAVEKPLPLHVHTEGITEEIDAEGRIVRPLDRDAARNALSRIRNKGIDHLAIVLKHAWKNPCHERELKQIAVKEAGFFHVATSHEIMPLCNMLKRGQTTMIEAYLGPVLFLYIRTLQKLAGKTELELMQSSGGLISDKLVQARNTILSGPAGGVNALAIWSRRLGIDESIGFDMGGTSTDVSRYGGDVEHKYEHSVSGIAFYTDMLDVETVAAGGGSLLTFDGMRMVVGPESAGASPGPACYGLGGPAAVTDANLQLGRIIPEHMPETFGPEHDRPLDRTAAKRALEKLAHRITSSTESRYSVAGIAAGYLRIANEIMARAMKKISVARGYDIRNHALVCFGGAAAQHACDIAEILSVDRIVVPPYSALLSAYGIAFSDRMERRLTGVLQPLSASLLKKLRNEAGCMADSLQRELDCPENGERTITTALLELRPAGSDTPVSVECAKGSRSLKWDTEEAICRRFDESYMKRFGFRAAGATVEVVTMRVEVRLQGEAGIRHENKRVSLQPGSPHGSPGKKTRVWTTDRFEDIPLIDEDSLYAGIEIDGPAMIAGSELTLFIQRSFHARMDRQGCIVMTRSGKTDEHPPASRQSTAPDPVLLEVFSNLFMNIAEQMGYTLANTAHSINMKERLDFSCALFDHEGRLAANAPHIPVHLGAMDDTIRHIIAECGDDMQPGDMYMANNPHKGGSHLPDITVVAPVFCNSDAPSFYIANRGHHADIGGITPGSMPPSSRAIHEEGVVIDNVLLVRSGKLREREVIELLGSGPFPARNIHERLSDLRAQVAANTRGMAELQRAIDSWGGKNIVRLHGISPAECASRHRTTDREPRGKKRPADNHTGRLHG